MKKLISIFTLIICICLVCSLKAQNICTNVSSVGILNLENGDTISILGQWESGDYIVLVNENEGWVKQLIGETWYRILFYNDGLGEVIHEPKDAFPDNFATQFSWSIDGDSISLFSISSEIFLFRKKSIKMKVKKTKENEFVLLATKNKDGIGNWFKISRP